MKMVTIKKSAAIFMGICMLVGMLPVKAYAAPSDGTAYSINLNQNGEIAGLNSPSTADGNWSGSKVYMGSYQNMPLLWRVLYTGTSNPANNNQKLLLLQTDNIITELPFSATGNVWMNSSIKEILNSETANNFLAGFKQVERDQIYAYSKAAGADTSYNRGSLTNPALNADKVFLLSAEESMKSQYGYSSPQGRKLTGASLGSNQWWLRSGKVDDSSMVGIIDATGELGALGIKTAEPTEQKAGVAPAVYLDTSKILFTTQVSGSKDSFSLIQSETNQTEWKLTLSRGGTLEASINGSVYDSGNDIIINHNAANAWDSNATQVSAILKDNSGKPLYYGKINGNNQTTSTVNIPDTLEVGNYKLFVFAEEVSSGKATDYASELGNAIDIIVKTTPIISGNPSAGGITYNQSLAESTLSGGRATVGSTDIQGQFTWKDSSIRPSVADSNKTLYEVIFTPNDTAKYNITTTSITIGVAKDVAPNKPQPTIQVDYGVTKVSQIPLPDGWSWRPESANKDLTAGGETQAIAVYKDTANYTGYDITITITRYACAHAGGSATCTTQAICDICKQPYGDVNRNVHVKTEIRNGKDSTCTVKGYTGDTYCVNCNQMITKGTEIALKEHNYTSVVTREPTVTVEGILTFTCTTCKHQYTQSMGKHSHYYNGTRTIRWLGCEQQGEIEHYCSCGDSYVDITPALGHAFVAKVTTKATTQKAGIKTFTCSRCGHAYTEVIPKLSGGTSQGGSSSGSGSGSSGGANPISDRIPFVEGNSSISGWTDINKMITKAVAGDNYSIKMNDALLIPKKTLETIKGKDVTLSLDIGNNMKWSICGTDITSEKLTDINLKVTKNSSGIPADLVKEVAGELSTMQLSLAHDGEFGGTVQLLIPVDAAKGGYYANLFYYNKETGGLDYIASNQMDGKGIATLSMTHASDYVIVMDTKVFDGSEPIEPETTIPTETEEPETIPVTDLSDGNTGGNGISIPVIIIIGLVVLGIGLIFIIVLRARSRNEDY